MVSLGLLGPVAVPLPLDDVELMGSLFFTSGGPTAISASDVSVMSPEEAEDFSVGTSSKELDK